MGSCLGVVELTVALHHVFNCPEDKFLWDVGHQVRCSSFALSNANAAIRLVVWPSGSKDMSSKPQVLCLGFFLHYILFLSHYEPLPVP